MRNRDFHDWRYSADPLIQLGYIYLWHYLKNVAKRLGYALTIHGSISRDLDIVAIPWTSDAASFEVLVRLLSDASGSTISDSVVYKPHGRKSVLLILPNNNGVVDLSVMPKASLDDDCLNVAREAYEGCIERGTPEAVNRALDLADIYIAVLERQLWGNDYSE